MRKRLFTIFVAVWLCVMFCPQFGMFVTVRAASANFSVDVLLDYGNGTRIWSTSVLSTPGKDTVYNATQAAAATLSISWFGDDIFVDAINGVWNNMTTGYWWAVFVWNYSSGSWQALSVACNKHQLTNNDMVAWHYDVHPWPPVPPPNPPVTQIDVMLDYGNGTVKWYANANVIGAATVFKATQAVTTLNYSWWGDDVFLDAINKLWNSFTTNCFWLYWYWNSTSGSWNFGPVACNKHLLNNGDVIAWYYETDPWGPPSTTGMCARSDITGDGIVTINDVVIAALAFGNEPGDPNWNPIADIRQDGIINIIDLVIIGVNFGKSL